MMAEVNKSAGTTYRRASRSNSYSHLTNATNVSSDIVEAMDRIFPKSPSKFLQNPFPVPDSSGKEFSKNISSFASILNLNSAFACTMSNANIATDTTTTATAVFTGLSTSASGSKSPIMSSVPAFSNDMPPSPASAVVENSISELNGKSSQKSKPLSKSKGSRIDLEICNQTIVDSPRTAIMEKLCSDSQSLSQDVEPIVKKKKKKKHDKKQSDIEGNRSLKIENSNVSDNSLLPDNCMEKVLQDKAVSLKDNSPNEKITSDVTTNGYDSYLNHEIESSSETVNDNQVVVYPPSVIVQQKLPRVKRRFINVLKDRKYLRKKVLPCFVLLKKADILLESRNELNLDLSLSERIKYLSGLCNKNEIKCHKSLPRKLDILSPKNIFEDSLIENNSEDEFVAPRGRSLRKRNHNVCYVEPSEYDVLEDYTSSKSKKRKLNSSQVSDSEHRQDENQTSVDEAKGVNKKTFDNEQQAKQLSVEKKNEEKTDGNNAILSLAGENSRLDLATNPTSNQDIKKTDVSKASSEGGTSSSAVYSSNTIAKKTPLIDKEGRSLVYVFPKGSIVKQAKKSDNSDSTKTVKSRRPGPASKTLPNPSTSVAPVTTLSLPRSLLSSIGTQNVARTSVAIPSVSGNSTAPQFYMVKIDGKDFLVPILSGTSQPRSGIPSAITLPSTMPQQGGPCRLIYQPVSTLPTTTQAALTRAPGLTQPFPLATIMAPATSSAPRLSNPLSTSTVLSPVPLIGTPQVATTCIPATRLSQATLRSAVQTPSSAMTTAVNLPCGSTSLVSLVRPPSMSQIYLTSAGISSGPLLPSTAVPLAAPTSTAVPRTSRPRAVATTVTSTTQLVPSGTSATGSRCFRIIVPACAATGQPARIATLGTPINSSPLTRMSISSVLLPQRKASTDKEMSPEKRAAKRRRLEKKYPLPPGVVIKTEPLDSPQSVTTVQAGSVRSLLRQNIQLVANNRGVQNIRIIAPPMGSRQMQMRLGPNLILRAPSVTSGIATPGSVSALPAVAVSGSSLVLVSPPAQSSASVMISHHNSLATTTSANSKSTKSPATTIDTSIISQPIVSVTPTTTSTISSASTTTTTIASTITTTATISSANTDQTCRLTSLRRNSHPAEASSKGTPPDKITTLSYSVTSTASSTPSTGGSGSLMPATASKDTPSLLLLPPPTTITPADTSNPINSFLRQSIQGLQVLVEKQEKQGLTGPRLQKLKDLLAQKEKALAELRKEPDVTEESEVDTNGSSTQKEPLDEQGATSSDPVVID